MADTVVSGQGPAAHSRDIPASQVSRAPGREGQGGPAPARRTVRPRRAGPGVLLAIVLVAQLLALLDASIVNVAIPTIQASLRASGASLQLVVAGHTPAYSVRLGPGALRGGIPGPRREVLTGLA